MQCLIRSSEGMQIEGKLAVTQVSPPEGTTALCKKYKSEHPRCPRALQMLWWAEVRTQDAEGHRKDYCQAAGGYQAASLWRNLGKPWLTVQLLLENLLQP